MKITITVDANPIISALLGGKSRNILFNQKINFITTEYTIKEIEKYIPFISKKSSVAQNEIYYALSLLPITAYPKKYYKSLIPKAKELIGQIDQKDIEILALTLKENSYLWSQDKHFEKINYSLKLLKTEDLV